MPDFLLEIGTEEIPAGYIAPALAAMADTLAAQMAAQRIDCGRIQTFGTPMRLTVAAEQVAERQKPLATELQGPPANVAFDAEGRPRQAALKFAEKAGVPVSRLAVRQTAKGAYVFAVKRDRGRASRSVLRDVLPKVIAAVPFPKRMRWGDLSVEFARPIHSLVALLGTQVVGFEFAGIKSGRHSRGHRFMHPVRIRLESPADYLPALRQAHVFADIEERRRMVREAVAKGAESVGGRVLADEELLDIVTNLVEYPVISLGSFEQRFLQLPDEVLITAMREHQKYFAVVDGSRRLLPHFVAVNNTAARDMIVVTRGHERVLRARLEDARFFFNQDMQLPLSQQAAKLDEVLLQAKLGSVGEKVRRLEHLAVYLAEKIGGGPSLEKTVRRAAALCKADLVTQMVGEFPKLQGVMGRLYAERQGEPAAVAAAIEEHYRPVSSGAALPETEAGAILSIADKIDAICGCFSVGLVPSGTADPYALRRQGIGVIQIMVARNLLVPLPELVAESLALLADKAAAEPEPTARQVLAFLANRAAGMLAEEGYPKDTVAAVLGAPVAVIADLWAKAAAIEQLKAAPDFEQLAAAFKRVVNIIRKAEGFSPAPVDPQRFEHDAERRLLEDFERVERQVVEALDRRAFSDALTRIVALKAPVDDFFEKVLVMAEDPAVRRNRLSLLGRIADLFNRFADFSRLAA